MSLKRILLIGDSIRIGYTPFVKDQLEDEAEILIIKENCEDSEKVQKKLKKWLKEFGEEPIDIIHFNCGLHDIKRKKIWNKKYQVPIDKYKNNLREIVSILKYNTKTKLVWATITPVIFERHHKNKPFDRYESDVELYNTAAIEIMKENDISINDLHSIIVKNHPEQCILQDGVHMTNAGYSLLANGVVSFLREL